jgi:signal transduction histidine kinase
VTVRVEVQGEGIAGRVVVEVEDDGAGLSPERDRKSGTDNLAARARRHGGTFTLGTTDEGRGTLLTWSVPLAGGRQRG